jgi:hypothetical protein
MNLSPNASTVNESTHYLCTVKLNGSEFSSCLRKNQTLEYLILKIFAELHYKSLQEFSNDVKMIYGSKNLLEDFDETTKLNDIFTDESKVVLILERKNSESENKKKYIIDHLKNCLEKIDESSIRINKQNVEEIIKMSMEIPISNICGQIEIIKNNLNEKLQSHCENLIFLGKIYENCLVNENLNIDQLIESLKNIKYIDFFSLVNYFKKLKKELEYFNTKLKGSL